jgi:glycine dehydrogenase
MIDDTSKEFIGRHIGPSKDDRKKMLYHIGSKSLDQLIRDTVPENILLKSELKISE